MILRPLVLSLFYFFFLFPFRFPSFEMMTKFRWSCASLLSLCEHENGMFAVRHAKQRADEDGKVSSFVRQKKTVMCVNVMRTMTKDVTVAYWVGLGLFIINICVTVSVN